jgi:transcriptional regulator with XRE-family HTH domain
VTLKINHKNEVKAMVQALHAQLPSITSMDVYRQQNSVEQSQSYQASAKRSRNRGVVLSRHGWQKLMQAGVLCDEFGGRYTYEQLSERSHLDERTVSRLLSCEVKVDKSTLKTFFRAFNLSLEVGDHTSSNANEIGAITSEALTYAPPARQALKVEQLVEELNQLKQRMGDYEHLFYRLGLNENHFGQQLRA